MASLPIHCPACSATKGVVRNGKSTSGHQRYLCQHCRKTWQLSFTYAASYPGKPQQIIDMAMNGVGCRVSGNSTNYGNWTQYGSSPLKKLKPLSVTTRITPGAEVIICAELDEQWGWVVSKSHPRWLFYAYDKQRKSVIAHVFGERNLDTLERLLALLSEFDIVVWMTDGWPAYAKRLKREIHTNSKRFTQRIERHNLNLRQHIARLGRKTLSFSKSVELHDKVIGYYMTLNHYQ